MSAEFEAPTGHSRRAFLYAVLYGRVWGVLRPPYFVDWLRARIYFAALSTSSRKVLFNNSRAKIKRAFPAGRPFSNLARGLGFEPRLEVPKTPVLPLDDPRTVYKVRVELPLWSFYCTQISMHYKLKFCDFTT